MGNFFSKPLSQVDASDILDLIGTPEGQVFEIKSKLPADKKSHDPWYDTPEPGKPRNGPGDNAKQDIFKELVAFANSEGGWLVLGLTETLDHPKRVAGVAPLPDCHELAERFKRAAYDWIDPPLPSLQCRGIEMEGGPGEGVIMFRVPRSLYAPHRVYKKDKAYEAYKRVSDESKPMKMREIQGLTLDMARGQERIDREFESARKRYLEFKPQRSPKRRMVGFNITLVPLSGPIIIDRPYKQTDLFERRHTIEGLFKNGQKCPIETIDANFPSCSIYYRPILRGARKIWFHSYIYPTGQDELIEEFITVEISASGTIQLSVKATLSIVITGISLDWILADIANALCIAERTRNLGGMPDSEYAMEIGLGIDEINSFGKSHFTEDSFRFGILKEVGIHFSQEIGPGFFLLPRYPVGRRADFPEIIKRVMNDLYNAVGKPDNDELDFVDIC
jgi:hypothetical protein